MHPLFVRANAARFGDPSRPVTLLAPTVDALYDTYDLGVNFWIRPAGPASGLPAFRVNPWRNWGWEHRTSDGLAWAVQAAAAESPLFANGFE